MPFQPKCDTHFYFNSLFRPFHRNTHIKISRPIPINPQRAANPIEAKEYIIAARKKHTKAATCRFALDLRRFVSGSVSNDAPLYPGH